MSLSVTVLKNELRRMFDPDYPGHSWPGSRAIALDRLRDAYDLYGSSAEDVSGDAVASKSPSGFRAALNAMLSTWTDEDAAAAMAAAWTAYWTGATFGTGSLIGGTGSGGCQNEGPGTKVFLSETSSAVTATNSAPLYAALLAEFQILSTDGEAKAQAIAECFHAATIANITVRIDGLDTTPPPDGPKLVWNICTVF